MPGHVPSIGHGLSQAASVDFIHQAVRHIIDGIRQTGSQSLLEPPLSGFFCEPSLYQWLGDVTALGCPSDE